MKRYFTSIGAKLGLIVIAGVMSAVLLVSLTAAWRETNRRIGDLEAELKAIGEALAATLSLPLSQEHRHDVARALRAAGKMRAITYARVVDTRGETIAHFGVGIVLQSQSRTVATELGAAGIQEALRLQDYAFSVPVISGGVRVGRLDLVADVSSLSGTFRRAIEHAVVMALAAAIIGLLIAMPMLALVTQPIRNLTESMRSIRTTADYSRVDHAASNDETGILLAAFNDLLSNIRERDSLLARHRSELELAVVERTAELEIAKRAAESANAAKSDFLAAMSHEIRTPMHGMLATTELLQTTPLDARQKQFAEMITKSGRSLLAIVNDILDLSKIEAGRMELEAIPIAPATIANDVVQLFTDRAAAKGLTLQSHCEPNVPHWILGDPVRLQQIMANLIGNALKFTERGRVLISLGIAPRHADDAGCLRIAVSDTGIGIPPDSMERIFQAFAQASQDTSRHFGGTGIGLSISQRLTVAMGGSLRCESRVGEGSTFTCSIPVTAVEAPTARTEPAVITPQPEFAGLRVLAADDNAVNRAVLEATLSGLGVETVSVEDGEAAVAAFVQGRFDIIYMDCSMPVLDGYAAARRIRAHEALTGQPAIPIVALTAQVIGSRADEWREAGMTDCLTKPFTLAGITANLVRWSGERLRRQREDVATRGTPPQPKEPTPSGSPLNDSVVEQILAMDRNGAFIERLVRLFKAQGVELLQKLDDALGSTDPIKIGQYAHAMKSICLSIGAQRAADAAAEIEQQASATPSPHLRYHWKRLSQDFEAALVELEKIAAARIEAPAPAARTA